MRHSSVILALSLAACSSSGGSGSAGGNGGAAGSNGSAGSSTVGTGGASQSHTGGQTSSGGAHATGGTNNGTGGVNGTGGGNGTGGSIGSGGFPTGTWAKASSGLAGLKAMCGSSGAIVAMPNEDRLFAQIANHGVYTSVDGGSSWQLVAGSTNVTNSGSAFVVDPGDPTHLWEVGNHNGMGVLGSKDGGKTFTVVGSGTLQADDYLSIDFTDPQRKVMLVGPHEVATTIWRSTNAGTSWTNVGKGLPGVFCTTPLVIDASTYLTGCQNGEIHRTTDGAASWARVSTAGGNRAGLLASDGSIYWVGQSGNVIRSGDKGKTWTQALGNGSAREVPPIELPDGRPAIVTPSGIAVSSDQGAHWTKVTTAPPTTPWTFTYSKFQKAFFAAYGVCDSQNVIPSDVVARYAFDSSAP